MQSYLDRSTSRLFSLWDSCEEFCKHYKSMKLPYTVCMCTVGGRSADIVQKYSAVILMISSNVRLSSEAFLATIFVYIG